MPENIPPLGMDGEGGEGRRHRFVKARNMRACARCADMRKRCNMEAPYSDEGCEECVRAGISVCPPHRPRRARRTQKPYARPTKKPSVPKPTEDASIVPEAPTHDDAKLPAKTTRNSLPIPSVPSIPSSSHAVFDPDITFPLIATTAQDAEPDFSLDWLGTTSTANVVPPFVQDSDFSFGSWNYHWESQYHAGM